MASQNFWYLTIFLFCCVQSYVLPVEKCKLEDSGCMVSGFQKAVPIFMAGIPEVNVDVLDVMDMDDIKFDLSGLQFSLTEGKLKGLKNAVVDNVKWDTTKKTVDVHYHVDAQIQGLYTAGGMILVLPISGDGDLDLKLKNLEIKLRLEYEVEKDSKGKDHIAPKKYSFQFEIKDGANFALTNLFNGNKELSDTMLTFLNDNWKQISIEFGKPLVETAAKKIFKNIAKFFKKFPIEDIALV